jgi:hypothetical protein
MTKEIPLELRTAAERQDDVVLTAAAAKAGLSEHQCRRLARLSRAADLPRGVLLIGTMRDALRSRARAAQLLVPNGLIAGPTAARLLGMQGLPFLDAEEPIHLLLPNEATRWQRSSIQLHWTRRPLPETVDCDGLLVAGAEQTLTALSRHVDRVAFVTLADSAAHQDLVRPVWLEEVQTAEALRGDEHLWRLVNGRGESPSESRVRVVLRDGGLPVPDQQIQVRDDTGRIVARLDLGWRQQRVGLEVDSAEHDKPKPLYRDRYRQNDLLELKWDIRRVTGGDAKSHPAYVRQVARSALGL